MGDLEVSIQTTGPNGIEVIDVIGNGYGKWVRETTFGGTPRYAVHSVQVAVNLLESYGVDVPLFHLEAETHDEIVELYRGEDGTLKLNEKRKA